MDYENKIEFYKNRSLGERMSAAAEFLRQNGVVLYKNLLIPAIPLVLLEAYFFPKYIELSQSLAFLGASALASQGMFYIPAAMILSLFLYSMSGAVMSRYEEGLLSNDTKWEDLSGKMFSNAGKILLISLAMFLILVIATLILTMLVVAAGMILRVLAVLVVIVALFAFIPPLSLILFPAFFQNESTFKSIKKGFTIGFKNWGTIFLALLVIGVMAVVVSIILMVPFYLYTWFGGSYDSIVIYLLSFLVSLATLIVTPSVFVFLAFQYFSVAEKEEGISLQNKVDGFDNL